MKRIGLLHLTSNATAGHFFPALAKYHDRGRYRVVIGSLSAPGELQARIQAAGLDTIALAHRRRSYALAAARLAAWLRRQNISIVQTHLYDASVVGLLAARLAAVPLRILTTHHVNDSLLHFQLRGKRAPFLLDRFAARNLANRAIAVSRHVERTLVDSYGVAEERIARIPLGFELDDWRPSEEARQRLRAEWSLGDAYTFGTVGRLNWIKDHASLINAFALARAHRTDMKLVIVGGGDTRELLDLAASAGVASDVVITGYYPDLRAALSTFDFFVNSSLTEACNQSIVEALAMERYVIATAVGAAPEQIAHDTSGLLVPPGDTAGLAAALLRAIDLWGRSANTMGGATARELTAHRMVAAYEAAYQRWLGNSDHPLPADPPRA